MIISLVIILFVIFYLYTNRRIYSYFKHKREQVLKAIVKYEHEIIREVVILWYSGKGIGRKSRRFDGEVAFLTHSIILILRLPNGKRGKKFPQPIIQFDIDGKVEVMAGISSVESLDSLRQDESKLNLFFTKDTGLNSFETKVQLEFGNQANQLKSVLEKFNYQPKSV